MIPPSNSDLSTTYYIINLSTFQSILPINLERNTAERRGISAVTFLLVVRFIERFYRQPHGDPESGSKGFVFGDAVQLDSCGAEVFKQFFLLIRKGFKQFGFVLGLLVLKFTIFLIV